MQAGNARQALRDARFAMSYSESCCPAPLKAEAGRFPPDHFPASISHEAWVTCQWPPALVAAGLALEALSQIPEAALHLTRVGCHGAQS